MDEDVRRALTDAHSRQVALTGLVRVLLSIVKQIDPQAIQAYADQQKEEEFALAPNDGRRRHVERRLEILRRAGVEPRPRSQA